MAYGKRTMKQNCKSSVDLPHGKVSHLPSCKDRKDNDYATSWIETKTETGQKHMTQVSKFNQGINVLVRN